MGDGQDRSGGGRRSRGRRTLGNALGIWFSVLGVSTLVALIALSIQTPLTDGLVEVVDTMWGVTTMADLGIGLLLVIGWITLVQRRLGRPWTVPVWALLVLGTGNLAACVYLLLRCGFTSTLEDAVMPSRRG